MYRTIADIEKALLDRSRAEKVMARVSKGGKGTFSYVPWNESARLLNDIFGVFGWSTNRTGGVDDVERGLYIYDGVLTVRAEGEEGEVYHKFVAGRGVGVVAASQRENMEAHDTAAKGARSDFLSVACKCLGDAFGLFLYDKGDPARPEAFSNSNTTPAAANRPNTQTDTAKPSGANTNGLAGLLSREPQPASKDGNIGNVSPAQATHAKKRGWTDDMLVRLLPAEVKQVMDGVFGKGPVVNPPTMNAAKPAAAVEALALSDDADLPF